MATLRDYFITESNDLLAQIDMSLSRLDTGAGDPNDLARLARGLRGSAHLAREARVYRAGLGLEAAARALAAGRLTWNADVSGRVRRTVEDIYALVHAAEGDDEADARVRRVIERWQEAGVEMPASPVPGGTSGAGERSLASRQFREFAAHEVAGIAAEIETGLSQLAQDPRQVDALKAVLRRQRALLGAARLQEINVVSEALHAVEDLGRLMIKLNVPVKDEWYAAMRAARDVLASALEPLRQGSDPQASASLSTLRTLRTELVERYGEGGAVPVATAAQAMPAAAVSAPAATSGVPIPAASRAVADGIVITELCYHGERALRRALELRPQIEALAGSDTLARENVDQLFDLIRLGIG